MKKVIERTYYEEAMRYIDNAEELLKKAEPQSDGFYGDLKYVKSAAGTAYAGIEKAAKWYAKLNGIELKSGNVEMIKDGLRKINKKVLKEFVSLYAEIHIGIYYQDNAKIKSVNTSFQDAKKFMGHLKLYNQMVQYEDGGVLSSDCHISLGSAEDNEIKPRYPKHDAVAVCNCGEMFTYENAKKNNGNVLIAWKLKP